MTALDVFTYTDRQVRTVLVDGEPWFVARDVCDVLAIANLGNVLARLDDDEKSSIRLTDGSPGNPNMAIVNEAGLYSIILRSEKPEARGFKRWVTHDVLPEIRRTGRYGSALPASFAEALELAAAQARQIEAVEAELVAARPKVEAYDALMDADGYYSMEAAAKILGLGRTTFFRRLREIGVLQSGSRLPYQRFAHHFAVTTSSWTDRDGIEHLSYTPRVRPAGLDYLRRRLSNESVSA